MFPIEKCNDEIKNLVFIVPVPWHMHMSKAHCNFKISQLVPVEHPIPGQNSVALRGNGWKNHNKNPKILYFNATSFLSRLCPV